MCSNEHSAGGVGWYELSRTEWQTGLVLTLQLK